MWGEVYGKYRYVYNINMQVNQSEFSNAPYHVLFICKHQDDTVQHEWVSDDGLEENCLVKIKNWYLV